MAGRKTAYRKSYVKQAREACAIGGFSNGKLGKLFGVSKTTVWEWRQKYPEFDEACRGGYEEYAVTEAHKALTKLVKGYSYTEVTQEAVKDSKTGQIVMQETKRVRKHVQSSPSAAKLIVELAERRQGRTQQQGGGELSDLIANLDGNSRKLASSELFSEPEESSCQA
ncbi:hypothetical protein [Halodesulfovibrio sp.]|jgi:hypothetical protein|uniref:hypothetical protein n=1 Tax=Halodesulfovibrio sp. TaxID=1912772 RepID=UPI0025E6715D|nr:hypothetical protein [Halodesulfovibrio sp.]MCT4627903.1 hypothetical protein [Halodesulfovibrio sp.]